MAGHSKWHQIKHQKGVADQKRGALFSKLLKAIAIAARDNPDPQFNPRLRSMIQAARENKVPNENIERALSRSAENKDLTELTIEAYGPEKSALIIEVITDSKNRTIAEVKTILADNSAKMADPGSVLWAFKNDGGRWQAQFEQTVSAEAKNKIAELVKNLEAHDDVQKVTTNINS